jgi:hypothetical protein
MRFKIATSTASNSQSARNEFALLFEYDGVRLLAIGEAEAPFDLTVQSFDPAHDIFYRTPEALTPEALAEEANIHVPNSLWQKLNKHLLPSTLDGLVLMQHVASDCPAISPLPALTKILLASGTVNSAILCAENGGTLYVRNAGTELHAGASAHSLKELLDFTDQEREEIFPNLHASEILLCGSDLDHFRNLDLGPLSTSRRVAISDFTELCEFTPRVLALVELNPHLYTLLIGAATVYAEILRERNAILELNNANA